MESYKSQEEVIARKAKEKGISLTALHAYFDRKIEQVTAEFPRKSSDWRLGRAEYLIWEHFFPGESFPGKLESPLAALKYERDSSFISSNQKNYPPLADTRNMMNREWVHDKFALVATSPKGDSRRCRAASPKPIDSYRPDYNSENRKQPDWPLSKSETTKHTDTKAGHVRLKLESSPLKQRSPLKGRSPLKLLPNGLIVQFEESPGPKWRSIARIEGCTSRYLTLSPSIENKARSIGITLDELGKCYKEKAIVARKKFFDRSKEWQVYFVEASVWGHFLLQFGPFPGVEPSKSLDKKADTLGPVTEKATIQSQKTVASSSSTNGPTIVKVHPPEGLSATTSIDKTSTTPTRLKPYIPQESENLMELKARAQGKRKDFFQYLQKMRTYSRSVHQSSQCAHIRGWFADQLTWSKFFNNQPYPFSQPAKVNVKNCKACALLPCLAPVTTNGLEGIAATNQAKAVSQASKYTRSDSVSSTTSMTKQVATHQSNDQFADKAQTTEAISKLAALVSSLQADSCLKSSSMAARQKKQQDGLINIPVSQPNNSIIIPVPGTRSFSTNAGTAHIGVGETQLIPLNGLGQSFPPADMLQTLSQMWQKDKYLSKGTIVMHNKTSVVLNKARVSQLADCFRSDSKEAMIDIGKELKCDIHYNLLSTGDLLLWTEAYTPTDVNASARGALFLQGWLTRVLSFGLVKPSFYWNEIRSLPSAQQAIQGQTPSQVTTNGTAGNSSNGISSEQHESACASATASSLEAITERVTVESVMGSWRRVDTDHSEMIVDTAVPNTSGAMVRFLQHPSFEDPENHWRRYKDAFQTSDVDRLVVEEKAKIEAGLRMVLDEQSGDIVSVGELVKRTIYRCSSSSGDVVSQSPRLLMDVDAIENEPDSLKKSSSGSGLRSEFTAVVFGRDVSGTEPTAFQALPGTVEAPGAASNKRKADVQDGDDGQVDKRVRV